MPQESSDVTPHCARRQPKPLEIGGRRRRLTRVCKYKQRVMRKTTLRTSSHNRSLPLVTSHIAETFRNFPDTLDIPPLSSCPPPFNLRLSSESGSQTHLSQGTYGISLEILCSTYSVSCGGIGAIWRADTTGLSRFSSRQTVLGLKKLFALISCETCRSRILIPVPLLCQLCPGRAFRNL
ncbi:hypothetical protein K474DRAFT_696330 [Panus rudis PR-1116 ss-1]|nr:hypothetical protein K474DRAFT_696330 [Panus rudis PR-1116 ss-1]